MTLLAITFPKNNAVNGIGYNLCLKSIGLSQGYTNKSGAGGGIDAVKRAAPDAAVIEE